MASQWYVTRAGRETGPYTGTQLREMATRGELRSGDLVRRDDMSEPRSAGSVKGLFPAAGVGVSSGPPQPPDQPKQATSKRKWLVIGVAVAAVLFLSCGGLLVGGFLIANSERQEAKKSFAEADALWTANKHDEAAVKYRSALKGL